MFHKGLIYFFLIAVMAFSTSCGKNAEQEVKDAITSANILLSTSQCQPAIDLLEGIGRQNKNAHYLKALSSAYACRAGYSTVKFFGSDVEKTATPAPLGGITTYSTSLETFTIPLTNDTKFSDLRTAINLLTYAGGIAATTEPTASERAKYFTENQAADINTQLAFMMMVQAGRLMKVYADTSAAGAKGAGSASNNCFTDYATINAQVEFLLSNQAGACTVKNSSHNQLNSSLISVAERRKRMCEGIVLINGIIDLLPSIIASAGSGALDDLADLPDDVNDAKAVLTVAYPAIGEVLSVLSQTNCEESSGITTQSLESFYAILFEGLIE